MTLVKMCDIEFIKICEKLDKIISTVYVENPTNDLQIGSPSTR